MLYDEEAGGDLKATLEHLNVGSQAMSEDLEAVQHNFLLRGTFKKLEKQRAKEAEAQRAEATAAQPVPRS